MRSTAPRAGTRRHIWQIATRGLGMILAGGLKIVTGRFSAAGAGPQDSLRDAKRCPAMATRAAFFGWSPVVRQLGMIEFENMTTSRLRVGEIHRD